MNIQAKNNFIRRWKTCIQSAEEGKRFGIWKNIESWWCRRTLSGYRLGTEDGNIVARWDNTMRTYILSAQLRGLHGTVKIKWILMKMKCKFFILEKL